MRRGYLETSRRFKAALIAIGVILGIWTVCTILVYLFTSFSLWLIGGK